MFSTARRRIGIITPYLAASLVLGCGNTHPGATYSDEGNAASVSQLQVTDTAYFSSNGGVEFLVAGDAPSGELSFVHLTFFDADGRPIQVDTNNDGTPDATSMDMPASSDVTGQEFFMQFQWDESLSTEADRVGAQAVDYQGNLSNTVYADLDGRPRLNLGDPCDLRGFDACPEETTCQLLGGDWQTHCIANSSK
jgi:hypothetical protein